MKLGLKLTFVTPLKDAVPQDFSKLAEQSNFFHQTLDLGDAVRESEFIYTDTWINMEYFSLNERDPKMEEKVRTMLPYQVNKQLIEKKGIFIMHDMPVHPGFEIDDYSINCEKSLIFQQAENRLYTAQALLLHLLDAV
jgi:ornithine carbamoyltransferase